MRHIALTCLCLALSGCGYNTWWNPPFTPGTNPNFPAGASENMRRAMGEQVNVAPLNPEPGDIWPGPLPQEPTLQELEQGEQSQPEQPVPGSPEFENRQPTPYQPPPPPSSGSSTPPGSNQPGLTNVPPPAPPSPQVNTAPPPPNPAGKFVPTQKGPGVTTGGTSGYQTLQTPGGGTAIIVPNGNGTSTIIHSDGSIETVPTPR